MKNHALPLDFQLHNANGEAVLVLGGTLDMTLEIRNNLPTPLYLSELKQQHHFSLRFRSGVLRDHHIHADKADLVDWHVDTAKEQGDVLVRLRHKTLSTWPAGHTLKLTLQGLRGEVAGGTRATRVELDYQHISDRHEPGSLIVGKPRHHQMVITMPSPAPPQRTLLEAHFVGDTGNVVLNDGKPHDYTLRLRLTNPTPHWLLLKRITELRLTLTCGDKDAPGALATCKELLGWEVTASVLSPASDLGEAAVEAKDRGWIPRPDSDRVSRIPLDCIVAKHDPVWTLRAPENLPGPLELRPDGFLEIQIAKIVTGHANGPSGVRVQWLDISHPDADLSGELVATLQKSPLVVVGGKVGIGTTRPEAALAVEGDLHIHGRLRASEGLEVAGVLKVTEGLELGNAKLRARAFREKKTARTVAQHCTEDEFEAFKDWPTSLAALEPLTFTFPSPIPSGSSLAHHGAVRIRVVPATEDPQTPPSPVAFDSGPIPATATFSGTAITVKAEPGNLVTVTDIPVQGGMKSLTISSLLCPDQAIDQLRLRELLADMSIAAGNWAHSFGRNGSKVFWTIETTYSAGAFFIDVAGP
ncbi:MAG: hypothetical protein HY020_16225 [Burkholderiales bacterium]|nr:hypothetical protein [Burkholderiales bacterium]